MPNRMAFSKGLPPLRLRPQQQIAQLGALAGKARLSSLAYPPPLTDFLGARTHVIVPLHHLLEQLSGYARIGQGAVGVARRLVDSMPNHVAASLKETHPWPPTSIIEV